VPGYHLEIGEERQKVPKRQRHKAGVNIIALALYRSATIMGVKLEQKEDGDEQARALRSGKKDNM